MHHPQLTIYQRWASRLVKLYPASWRERYAEEMLLILEESQPTLKTILNLLLNLCDAYLHQSLVNERPVLMLQRMRSNELAIYGSTLIFFVAWLVVQLHVTMPGQPRVILPGIWNTPSPLLNTIHTITYILPLLILFGGPPILLAACWQALKTRNVGALLLCLPALVSPLLAMVLPFILFPSDWLPLWLALISLGLSLAFILFAVRRVAPSPRITRYALTLAAVIPVVMLVGLAALLIAIAPTLATTFWSGTDDAFFYVLREDLLILIMIAALSFILVSLKKAFQARSTLQQA